MIKIFVDTNILIDILERRQPFFFDSSNIFNLAFEGKVSLYVSPLTIINSIYICRKHIGLPETIEKIKILRKHINITSMTEDDIDNALSAEGKDIEDNLQYYSALSAGCEILVTRNVNDFAIFKEIPIETPQDFLGKFIKN